MTIKQDPYHVLDNEGEEVFTGTHQECLKYELEQDNIELVTLPVNEGTVETFELEEGDYDYSYED